MQKISIIIPAYNEERRIGNTLEIYSGYFEELRKAKRLEYELLIVINNTKDRTLEIVESYAKKSRRIKYLNLVKGGKGYAVIEGFKDALTRENDLIGFVDADCSTEPDAFYDLISKIGNNGGAIASRYIKGAVVNPKPLFRRILVSRIFNLFIRAVLLFPYKDTQCGAKLFKREALQKALPSLTLSKWAFDVDLIYSIRKKGFHIAEIPTVWSDKTYSKINFMKAGPWMALGIIRLRLLNSPFRSIMRIYDKLFYKLWRLT